MHNSLVLVIKFKISFECLKKMKRFRTIFLTLRKVVSFWLDFLELRLNLRTPITTEESKTEDEEGNIDVSSMHYTLTKFTFKFSTHSTETALSCVMHSGLIITLFNQVYKISFWYLKLHCVLNPRGRSLLHLSINVIG